MRHGRAGFRGDSKGLWAVMANMLHPFLHTADIPAYGLLEPRDERGEWTTESLGPQQAHGRQAGLLFRKQTKACAPGVVAPTLCEPQGGLRTRVMIVIPMKIAQSPRQHVVATGEKVLLGEMVGRFDDTCR